MRFCFDFYLFQTPTPLQLVKHISVLPRVELRPAFFKPLGALALHLLQQSVPDLYEVLLQPACTFYNSVDDRVTYASVPKWTDASKFCRLPDECDLDVADISIQTHQRYKLEKLVSSDRRYCHTKAAWF